MGDEPRDRLIKAAIAGFADRGHLPVVRQIADRAQLSASAINYHFGSLEHLYRSAAEDAFRQSEAWVARVEHQAQALQGLTPSGFGVLIATIIDDWCTNQRAIAIAWRRTQIGDLRDVEQMALPQMWQDLWDGFWFRLSALVGLQHHADLIGIFFDAESFQHLIPWNRLIDRGALDELCQTFVARLICEEPSGGQWRGIAQRVAGPPPSELTGPAAHIASAALSTLGKSGYQGFTHRAVAQEAGVSLGAVSHHFTSASDLMQGAYLALRGKFAARGAGILRGEQPLDRADLMSVLIDFAVSAMSDEENRAIDEMRLLSVSDASLLPIASRMRYERGRSSGEFLSRIAEFTAKVTPLDGALLSTWLQGLRRSGALLDPQVRRSRAVLAINRYLDLLAHAPSHRVTAG